MQFNSLGHTGINLPEICLGTMTFGEQNTQQEAFKQLNYALEHGLYFGIQRDVFCTTKPETYGATETILGHWFAQHGQRDKVFLASKIAGPGFGGTHIREGHTKFNSDHISQALDGSLKRLQTDYIDLYQLHWPERHTNFFGTLAYSNQQAQNDYDTTPLEETLLALQKKLIVDVSVISVCLTKHLGAP